MSMTTPGKAFIITSMLKSSLEQGTGCFLKDRGIHFPAVAKTGTTIYLKDGWFLGYNPRIMALICVGFD